MQPYEKVERDRKQILVNNFLGGISWGLGATIGLAVVLAVLGFILGKIDFIPIVGDFVSRINEYISQRDPRLLR